MLISKNRDYLSEYGSDFDSKKRDIIEAYLRMLDDRKIDSESAQRCFVARGPENAVNRIVRMYLTYTYLTYKLRGRKRSLQHELPIAKIAFI